MIKSKEEMTQQYVNLFNTIWLCQKFGVIQVITNNKKWEKGEKNDNLNLQTLNFSITNRGRIQKKFLVFKLFLSYDIFFSFFCKTMNSGKMLRGVTP